MLFNVRLFHFVDIQTLRQTLKITLHKTLPQTLKITRSLSTSSSLPEYETVRLGSINDGECINLKTCVTRGEASKIVVVVIVVVVVVVVVVV